MPSARAFLRLCWVRSMITAKNHNGFEIQRHDGPAGWVAIKGPFSFRWEAHCHMLRMEKTPGAEYRIYESLTARQPPAPRTLQDIANEHEAAIIFVWTMVGIASKIEAAEKRQP